MTVVGGLFLSPEVCGRIVDEIERDVWWQWGEINHGGASEVDLSFRRAQVSPVPASCEAVVAGRLLAVARSLARPFGTVGSIEGPNLLRYRPGDFVLSHADEDPRARVRPRKVTLIAFLNSGAFGGGQLRLRPVGRERSIDIEARVGRFVAFPARVHHEVAPLVGGTRYALVAWLH